MDSLNTKRGGTGMVVGVIIAIVIIIILIVVGMRSGSNGTDGMDDNATTTDDSMNNAVSLSLDLKGGANTLGQAVIVEESGNSKVILALADVAGTHPAHIHTGKCGSNGPIAYQLQSVTGGTSETVINGVTIASLLSSDHYVNVHKSASDLAEFACADIKGTVSAAQ